MPIKVSLTALRGSSTPRDRDRLLGELAQHASPSALRVLERLLRDPASLLEADDQPCDDALFARLSGAVDLAGGLGDIELDPVLVEYEAPPVTRAGLAALSTQPDAVLRALARVAVDEKSDPGQTLRPADALVEQDAARDVAPRNNGGVRAIDDEADVVEPPGGAADDAPPASVQRPVAADAAPDAKPDVTARDDIPAAAVTPQTEETMAVKHEQREDGAVSPADEIDAPASAEARAPQAAPDAEAPAPDAERATAPIEPDDASDDASAEDDDGPDGAPDYAVDANGDPLGYEGDADDLLEAVPPTARHFLALVHARGEVEMPEVMQHLGLVRAKGVGGAIEPIQRLARLLGVKMPVVADFAESGNKRWRWISAPLVEVAAELLEPLPMPPPTPKKKKQKARGRAKRDYKKQWGKRQGGSKSGERRGSKGRPRKAGPPAAAGAGAGASAPAGAAPRNDRAPAARGREAADPAGGRRRRFDRPMPEVFRRGGRPDERPAPARRQRSGAGEGRSTERISRSMPAVERPSASRTERPARYEAPATPERPRVDTPARARTRSESPTPRPRVDAPSAGRIDVPGLAGRVDVPGGGRVDVPGGGRIDGPGGGRIDGPGAGRIDGPGGGRIDGPGAHKRVDVPGRIAASRAEVERRSDAPEPTPAAAGAAEEPTPRKQAHSPEERLPLPRSGVFRRRTVSDTDVPVVVIRRRKR